MISRTSGPPWWTKLRPFSLVMTSMKSVQDVLPLWRLLERSGTSYPRARLSFLPFLIFVLASAKRTTWCLRLSSSSFLLLLASLRTWPQLLPVHPPRSQLCSISFSSPTRRVSSSILANINKALRVSYPGAVCSSSLSTYKFRRKPCQRMKKSENAASGGRPRSGRMPH